MRITWHGHSCFEVKDRVTVVTDPHDGSNHELAKVGASFGVIKLATDRPHWSDDGR